MNDNLPRWHVVAQKVQKIGDLCDFHTEVVG